MDILGFIIPLTTGHSEVTREGQSEKEAELEAQVSWAEAGGAVREGRPQEVGPGGLPVRPKCRPGAQQLSWPLGSSLWRAGDGRDGRMEVGAEARG